ncbi:MAG: Gfo/Idh/MocA family oxidoreductase [Actinomycetales bacterium]|nr:Gfo/Idh/MocA family oxidoreductase [Actinomycetales bacterium]
MIDPSPLRVGVVGAGLVGGKRAAALRSVDRLVGVVDVDPVRARALAEPHGARILPDTEDLAAHVGPDGVVIVATPHRDLVAQAQAARTAGCHVLIEKPGARGSAEFAMVESPDLSPAGVVRVGFNHRFHPAVLAARSLIRSGDFGPVRLVRARYGHGGRLGYEREWRADPEVSGGGELLDQGSHLLDLTHFLAGTFRLTHAELPTLHWAMPVEDNALLVGRLANGGLVSLHASWTEWKNLFSLEVALDRAKIEITGLGGSYGPETLVCYRMRPEYGPPDIEQRSYPGPDTSWRAEWLDVVAAVAGDPTTLGADARSTAEVLGLIDEARSLAGSLAGKPATGGH